MIPVLGRNHFAEVFGARFGKALPLAKRLELIFQFPQHFTNSLSQLDAVFVGSATLLQPFHLCDGCLQVSQFIGVTLFADFELSSLARFAWTFSAIEIDGLDLRGDIAPDGRFNLFALLDSLPKTEPKPDARLPRLLLRRVALSSGAISFSDRSKK